MSAIDLAIAQLKVDEGCELSAYPDALSALGLACARARLPPPRYRALADWMALNGSPWTIGVGATGDDIGPDTVWSLEQADSDLQLRVMTLYNQLCIALSFYGVLSEMRQAVLLNVAYNLGLNGLLAFKHMLGYLANGDYTSAVAELLNSKAARQLPTRYGRLATQMRLG